MLDGYERNAEEETVLNASILDAYMPSNSAEEMDPSDFNHDFNLVCWLFFSYISIVVNAIQE